MDFKILKFDLLEQQLVHHPQSMTVSANKCAVERMLLDWLNKLNTMKIYCHLPNFSHVCLP
jgi:hypothetical protein